MQPIPKDILICPKTKGRIVIDAAQGVARVEHSSTSYPINEGVIDFSPDTVDRVSKAYDSHAAWYDTYMTGSGLHWKLYGLIFFGFFDDSVFLQKPLSSIPSDFDGVLLDVPVGTGLFTADTYVSLPKATIVAIDYSLEMLRQAQKHYTQHNIRNVILLRADVANLPIQQGSIDMCLSMAGFHAFSNKDRALHEIARVLKPTGLFAGTCYIRGKWLLTDLLVKLVFCRKGFFTAPFFEEQECLSKFAKYFEVNYSGNKRSGFYFNLVRKAIDVTNNNRP